MPLFNGKSRSFYFRAVSRFCFACRRVKILPWGHGLAIIFRFAKSISRTTSRGFDVLRQYFNLDKYSGRFPNWRQWKKFWTLLSKNEKASFLIFFLMLFLSSSLVFLNFYYQNTEIKPAYFGEYSEAMGGQPRFANPLFASASDIDRDITQIVFSGLFGYDNQGKIIPDLAQTLEIKDGGKVYEVEVKDGVRWHDGINFSVEDVIFTYKLIQDQKIQSPQRQNWQGVKVEKVNDKTVRFTLVNPYTPFLENLTQQIIPKHIWENILPENFILAEYNLKPIGTGPFKFKNLQKDRLGFIRSYTLSSFDKYHKEKPFLREIKFLFYNNEEEILKSQSQDKWDGAGSISSKNIKKIPGNGLNVYSLKIPRYFAVFFNQNQSKALSDKNVRLSLAYAADKNDIINEVLEGGADVSHSVIPPSDPILSPNIKIYEFSPAQSKEILEKGGWRDENNDGFREKIITERKKVRGKWIEEKIEEIPLEINLTTVGTSELESIAFLLKDQWEKIGVKVNIEIYGSLEVQQEKIRPRNYQTLLFGEALGMIPDPFSFWHSSQKKDPGLNLSLYDNKEVDRLLEEARQTLDENARFKKYERFQQIIAEDLPAIFLYSPDYLYLVNSTVKGIEVKNIVDPSKRFVGIENWHVKTRRAWK